MSSTDKHNNVEPPSKRRRSSSSHSVKPRRRRPHLKVTRPVYSEHEFQKGYHHTDHHHFPLVQIQNRFRQIKCRLKLTDVGNFVANLIPIIHWLPRYSVRSNLLKDVIAGCTIGVMRIPQAMAYALLATLPAIYGLYNAFYPTLIYAFLGTSRHISIGTFAVVSIMTGNAIDNFLSKQGDTITSSTVSPTPINGTTPTPTEDNDDIQRMEIAMALCLLVGFIQLLMGILRLGFVTIYLSEPLVRGFTTGAAVHVFTSQFKDLFGIHVPRFTGIFSIVKNYVHFFSHLTETNVATLVISIVSIVFLMTASELLDYHANRGFCRRDETVEEEGGEGGQPAKKPKKRSKLPLPTELVVIVVATAISYTMKFEERYEVAVVGTIPIGLPAPVVPQFSYFATLLPDAIAIAIVAFAISVSMASLMAKRNNYEVNSNQELLAYGSCSIVGSFFHCFPHAASLSRSVVQESTGGKTQVAGFISSALVLVVLLFLGVLFTQLPRACLASVIVVALRGMFRQFTDICVLRKVSMIDLSIWVVSFIAVVFIGVDLGLLVAVLYSLATVIVRTQKPSCVLMGKVPGTDIYRDIAIMKDAEELPGIKIFRASSSLCFVNVEHFKSSLYSKVGIDPQKELTKEANGQTCCSCTCACLGSKENYEDAESSDEIELPDENPGPSAAAPMQTTIKDVHTIVIDCGMFSFIDVVGIKTLQNIVADYKKLGIRVVFANCKAPVRQSMLQSIKLRKDPEIDLGHMYVSIHDAVLHFATPGNSPLLCQPGDTNSLSSTSTKSSRAGSVTVYDFDPSVIAASLHHVHPSSVAASLTEHLREHPASANTTLCDVEEEKQKVHQVELHEMVTPNHLDNHHHGNSHVTSSNHTNDQPKDDEANKDQTKSHSENDHADTGQINGSAKNSHADTGETNGNSENGHVDTSQTNCPAKNGHADTTQHADTSQTNGHPKGHADTGQDTSSDVHQKKATSPQVKPCVNLAFEPEQEDMEGTPI